MGFFSWQTADTQESVMNAYTTDCKTVYFLQPDGKHIKEEHYEGYGLFNGVDAYEWLLKANAEYLDINTAEIDSEQLRILGIALNAGHFCMDTTTGEYWVLKEGLGAAAEAIIKAFKPNATINTVASWGENLDHVEIKYPIKVSFNPNADYDTLSASESCPYQGYFL